MNAHIHPQPAAVLTVPVAEEAFVFGVIRQVEKAAVVKAGGADGKIQLRAALFKGAHNGFAVKIHIRGRYHTGGEHFTDAHQRAVVDHGRRQFRFKRKDLFVEPAGKLHVFPVAPQDRHGRMAVGVIKRGHQQKMIALDHPSVFAFGAFLAHIRNGIAFGEDIHILFHGVFLV